MTGLVFKLAIIPPLVLMFIIYRMDRVEREPLGLIILLLVIGGVSVFPAAFLEESLFPLCENIESEILGRAVQYLMIVAVVEECLKFIIVKICTWKNPVFDHTFDGVVYSVTVSMGFALVENVMYGAMYGLSTVVSRAFTAILLHAVCGVCMGIYYGRAGNMRSTGRSERARSLLIRGLIASVLIHGFYDFCASSDSVISTAVLLVFLLVLYITAFKKVLSFQKDDRYVREDINENSC